MCAVARVLVLQALILCDICYAYCASSVAVMLAVGKTHPTINKQTSQQALELTKRLEGICLGSIVTVSTLMFGGQQH